LRISALSFQRSWNLPLSLERRSAITALEPRTVQCIPARFKARADRDFAASLDHARRGAQALLVKAGIIYPRGYFGCIAGICEPRGNDRHAGEGRAATPPTDRRSTVGGAAASSFGLLGSGSIDGLADIAEVLLNVKPVDNLNGVRE
jgi:hypothetical protein